MKCNIPAADDYTIWLYSSEGVVDNDHDYTLVITQ